jgi:hypothetical protein
MDYFFTKKFDCYSLGNVDYMKCPDCGFCASETHFDMANEEWEKLNDDFHSESHCRVDNPYNRNQRYFNQALMLHLAAKSDLLA